MRSSSIKFLTAILALVIIATTANVGSGDDSQNPDMKQRVYSVVLLWIKDRAKYEEYDRLSDPFVDKYGGVLERTVIPQGMYAQELEEKPDMVNVFYFPSAEVSHAFFNDPEFRKLLPLRSEAVDLIGFTGQSLNTSEVTHENVSERVYMIELAYFQDGDETAYNDYFAQMSTTMGKYGFHLERSVQPIIGMGLKKPDRINVVYFESSTGMEKSQTDPAHAKIERELYPAVVSKSIWINGKVADR